MKTKWFAIEAKADIAEISVFDEIGGWGITVAQFKEAFDLVKDKGQVTLMLNSPGGSVTEGMALYNILSSIRSKLTVEVVGVAASIASIVALAGKDLIMDEGTYFMIHNPWTITWGEADELRKTADVLDKMRGELINIYASRSGLDADEIGKMMDDETWLTADEARDMGFATGVTRSIRAAALATFDLSKVGFQHAPKALAPKKSAQDVQNIRDYERFLRDAGFSKSEAEVLASAGYKALRRDTADDNSDLKALIQAVNMAANVLK